MVRVHRIPERGSGATVLGRAPGERIGTPDGIPASYRRCFGEIEAGFA